MKIFAFFIGVALAVGGCKCYPFFSRIISKRFASANMILFIDVVYAIFLVVLSLGVMMLIMR